jgi:hypothetical protein
MIGDRDVVVVAGARTPFVKAGTLFSRVGAVELGRAAVREAVERAEIDAEALDEVIVGNIAGPADAANIARVIALEAKIPVKVPAFTVSRNCASGIESVVDAAYRIRSGDADLVVAGVRSCFPRRRRISGRPLHARATRRPASPRSRDSARVISSRSSRSSSDSPTPSPASIWARPPKCSLASSGSRAKTRTLLRCGAISSRPRRGTRDACRGR